MSTRPLFVGVAAAATFAIAACGDDGDGTVATDAPQMQTAATESAAGLVTVSPEAGAATIDDPPPDLVILDVRTPEEFDAGNPLGNRLRLVRAGGDVTATY